MRNAAEAKRIQEEKKMAKDFEKQEELRRMEHLKNMELSKEQHDAATRISLLYRKKKARRIVAEKRVQLDMESVIKENRSLDKRWIPFQKLFRQYSMRKWLDARGVKFNLKRKRKKKRKPGVVETSKLISKVELCARTNYEVQQRRSTARISQIDAMFQHYADIIRVRYFYPLH